MWRQVLIFTHDLAFVLLLQDFAGAADVQFHGATQDRARDRIGLARDELPFKGLTPQKQLKALRGELDGLGRLHRENDPAYPDRAEHWCMRLRQTWEHTVEALVLNGTVMRFRVSIETNRLKKVQITEDVKQRVERGITETSAWIHHRSLELHLAPRTPDQLHDMADDLRDLHNILAGKPPLRAVPDTAA